MRFHTTAAPEATAEESRYSVEFIEEVRERLNALIASSGDAHSAIDGKAIYSN